MEILYKILLNDLDLSYENMKLYGFSDDEIFSLIEHGVIEYVSNNTYSLVLVDKFRRYGVELLKMHRVKEANLCFKKCYELAPNGKEICLQYMISLIEKGNYSEIFDVFSNLEKIHPEKNSKNTNLYLYLLSFFVEFPEYYKNKVSELDCDDLILPVTKFSKSENEVRFAILNSKFVFAHQKIKFMLARDNGYSVKFKLIETLLRFVVEHENKFKENLISLCKNEQYEEIINILKDRQKLRYLSNMEMCVLIIVEAIVKLKQTNVIPKLGINNTGDMYEALVGNNFKLALQISDGFIEYAKLNRDEDIINLLLVKINELIMNIKIGYSAYDVYSLDNELFQDDDEFRKVVEDAENFAYYISDSGMTVEEANKKMLFNSETLLLIKLVFARDYIYMAKDVNDEFYVKGNSLLQEVEDSSVVKSNNVICLLNSIKVIRDSIGVREVSHSYIKTLKCSN